jgi:hypothetical protein
LLLTELASRMIGTVETWMLKVCVAGTFAGHGALAFSMPAKWQNYLNTAGFPSSFASWMMPLIGALDLALAVVACLPDTPSLVFAWMALWGFSTALMRPLSGESIL